MQDSGAAGDSNVHPPRTTREQCLKTVPTIDQLHDVKLKKDSSGKIYIDYKEQERRRLDPNRAHTIQEGNTEEDVRHLTESFLKMIKYLQETSAPSGVVNDETKVGVSPEGRYEEGAGNDKQSQRTGELLGKGSFAGDIVVVQDKQHGTEHAVKTVMLSEFRENEIRCWMDLNDSETFPSLYMFRLKDNEVEFHMEKIEHGVTLQEIIHEHMPTLRECAPGLVRPFSLCVLNGLLDAITKMNQKNWTHQDMHGGNVVIAKNSMSLKVLDFGTAYPLNDESCLNAEDQKKDILQAIRLFSGVYIGKTFSQKDDATLEREIQHELREQRRQRDETVEGRHQTLSKTVSEMPKVDEQAREDVVQMITMTYKVVEDQSQESYGDFKPLMQHIEKELPPETQAEALSNVASAIFPEFITDIDTKGQAEAPGGGSADDGATSLGNTAADTMEELTLY